MTRSDWRTVWTTKGASVPLSNDRDSDTQHHLMELGGYYSPTSSGSSDDHDIHFRYVHDTLGIGPEDSVYDVGCGAGALLYWLRDRCAAVGGCDFAETLIAHARAVLPESRDLQVREAIELEIVPQYDVVVSNGVFIYFDSEDYARDVLHRMIAKSRRSVGVLDVNDAAFKEEALEARRAAQANSRADYTGLEQLFLPRDFFHRIAAEHGMECAIEDSPTPHSVNARYRYHVTMRPR
jgi:trans-aconitate methyltransferase